LPFRAAATSVAAAFELPLQFPHAASGVCVIGVFLRVSSLILTLQGLGRGGGGDSCLPRLDAADQRPAAPNRLEGHPSRLGRVSLQEHTASERSSREHHQNNEHGLNLADASESLCRPSSR